MKINTIATLGVLCTALAAGSCCRQTPRTTETLPAAAAVVLQDYGTEPTVLNIESYTLGNENFRTVLWTGNNLQVTLMTIPVGGDVGLEQHMGIDQFLRIEEGMAQVMMGDSQDKLDFVRDVEDDYAIFVPAGKWHNIVNKGDKPLSIRSTPRRSIPTARYTRPSRKPWRPNTPTDHRVGFRQKKRMFRKKTCVF